MADLSVIDHIVVLMLENRSFDSMLGKLYPVSPAFDGLTGTESNRAGGKDYPVWNQPGVSPSTLNIPDLDPGGRSTTSICNFSEPRRRLPAKPPA